MMNLNEKLDALLLDAFLLSVKKLEESTRVYACLEDAKEAHRHLAEDIQSRAVFFRPVYGEGFRRTEMKYVYQLLEEVFSPSLRRVRGAYRNRELTKAEVDSYRRKASNLKFCFVRLLRSREVTSQFALMVDRPAPVVDRDMLMEPSEDLLTEFHTCYRKVSHVSRAAAESTAVRLQDDTLTAYLCVFCSGWHAGHQARGKLYGGRPVFSPDYAKTWNRVRYQPRAVEFLLLNKLPVVWKDKVRS